MKTLLLSTIPCLLALALSGGVARAAAEGPPRPLTPAAASAGKALYLRECGACHGDRGDGRAPAADFVDPRPRDFTGRLFRLRTTATGQPPTTQDILRVIERGIPGTAMPSFSFLPEAERRQIAAYVLRLADLLEEPEPQPIAVPAKPPPVTATLVERGRQLYLDAGCDTCHGKTGKGDGQSAAELKNMEGDPIQTRDFTRDHYRGGGERIDIYYRMMTGMTGTPMPAYGDVFEGEDMWAVVDYVLSLREPQAAEPLPSNPLAAGRQVAEKYSCRACHVLDDGLGGVAGPNLRISGQKLGSDWVREFLQAPRAYGKVYPWRVNRMPHLGLSAEEAAVMATYLAAMGNREEGPVTPPDPSAFPPEKIAEGNLIFMLRCTECHNMQGVIDIPTVKQEGPDLIHVPRRVDYEWAQAWILNPRKIDPKTRMVVPNITPEQAEAVRMFIWKSAIEAAGRQAAR
jgi:mono/diheme cytochrome c family protein